MQLKRINSAIDRIGRNDINENFGILERTYGKTAIDAQLAKDQSTYAVETSDEAKQKAESVQAQFNQVVVAGDSSIEAAQARVSADATLYGTLKDRLDAENAQIIQQLAQTEQKKADKTEVNLKADKTYLDANLSLKRDKDIPIGEWDISDTLKQQINGNAPILQTIADGIITEKKTTFFTSKNIFDKRVASNGYLSAVDGSVLSDANYKTTDYIRVKEGEVIYSKFNIGGYAFYGADFTFISGAAGQTMTQLTVPANVYYVRTYMHINAVEENMLTKNESVPTEYTPYKLTIDQNLLPDTNIAPDESAVNINLPNKLYTVDGESLVFHFDNFIHDAEKFNIDTISTRGIHYDKKLGTFGSFLGNNPITFEVYDGQKLLNSKNITLQSVSKSNGTGTKKCLFIGDSTTNAGKYTQSLLDKFAGDSMGVQLLGTRGTAPNLHEGRSGWSANEYTKSASLSDVTNAFWNPSTSKFDFSYYMSRQGYTSLDYVFIHLGINDIFNYKTVEEARLGIPTILSQFDTMINSIKSFNLSIKIGLMVTIPPNASQSAFGSTYGSGQTRWRYIAVYHEWLKELIAKYDGKEAQNIYLVPIHTQLDTEVHINDAVHPTDAGYSEMAKPIYYFLKNMG